MTSGQYFIKVEEGNLQTVTRITTLAKPSEFGPRPTGNIRQDVANRLAYEKSLMYPKGSRQNYLNLSKKK